MLYWMCAPSDLDDLVQECMIKIWKGKETFRGESSPKTWINRIVLNAVYDYYRRKGSKPPHEEFDTETPDLKEPSGGAGDYEEVVQQALAALSVEHREV